MKKILMFFMALLTLVAATPTANAKRSFMELPLFERAVLIIKNLKRFISQSTGRRYAMVMSFSGRTFHTPAIQ